MNLADLLERAQSGSAVAQCVLGICYLDGIDVEINYEEAFRFLSAAVGQGLPRAAANLARMHAEGLGIEKNQSEAVRLYRVAAEGGEFLAQIQLGRIYSRGDGVPADSVEALNWYSAAASQKGSVEDCEELREAEDYVRRATQQSL